MRRMTAMMLAIALMGLAGCEGEAELEEVPETAEIEFEPDEEPGEALELDEETVLGLDDVGEDIMATGWVSGMPLANGFFLRTENDRVIFVASDHEVSAGDEVRVTGPLVATEALVFEGWETDAFDAGFEAEWDVETVVYIEAFGVTQLGADQGMDARQDSAPGNQPAEQPADGSSEGSR